LPNGRQKDLRNIDMKKFLDIVKIPGIVVGCVVTLYGVFAFFDGLKDDISDTKDMVEYNNMQINDVSQQLYELQDTAEDIRERQIEQCNKLNNLTWIVRHRNEYTEEQLEELMDMMMRRSFVVASPTPSAHSPSPPLPTTAIDIRDTMEHDIVIIPVDTID